MCLFYFNMYSWLLINSDWFSYCVRYGVPFLFTYIKRWFPLFLILLKRCSVLRLLCYTVSFLLQYIKRRFYLFYYLKNCSVFSEWCAIGFGVLFSELCAVSFLFAHIKRWFTLCLNTTRMVFFSQNDLLYVVPFLFPHDCFENCLLLLWILCYTVCPFY